MNKNEFVQRETTLWELSLLLSLLAASNKPSLLFYLLAVLTSLALSKG
jgi:hypothetical protein